MGPRPGARPQSAATLGNAAAIEVDVTSEASIAKALAATEDQLAAPDILVASAGITGPNTTVVSYPVDAWRQVIDINLTGVFLCNRAVAGDMAKRGYGRIVNIASVAGKEGNPNASAYSASKAGVIGLTKSLGKELATTGVLVNCVAPAVVKTELFSQMTEQHIQYMLSKIPMNRFGESRRSPSWWPGSPPTSAPSPPVRRSICPVEGLPTDVAHPSRRRAMRGSSG